MATTKSKVAPQLRAAIAAVLIATTGGYATYTHVDGQTQEMLRNQYILAATQDQNTSQAVKLALVMASYYESSFRHIGTPYVDKLGKGQPLTTCNGITGPQVVQGRYYTPADCYRLERASYLAYERDLQDEPFWDDMTDLQRASVLDFLHNKGAGAFATSTMRKKLLAGDIVGACRENPKWSRGTVNGVSTVLPGLLRRGEANAELCEKGLG